MTDFDGYFSQFWFLGLQGCCNSKSQTWFLSPNEAGLQSIGSSPSVFDAMGGLFVHLYTSQILKFLPHTCLQGWSLFSSLVLCSLISWRCEFVLSHEVCRFLCSGLHRWKAKHISSWKKGNCEGILRYIFPYQLSALVYQISSLMPYALLPLVQLKRFAYIHDYRRKNMSCAITQLKTRGT